KAIPAWSAVGILLVCTLFNLLGSMAIAFMLSRTTLFSNLEATHYMYNAIETKLAKPYVAMFFDGIIANILVNIAIIGSVRIKETSAKILFVVAIIFIFCYFGFEHVIANFGDRKSTRLNSSHVSISYAVFCLTKKKKYEP